MNISKFYTKVIIDSTSYSGSHGHERIVSASSLTDDLLPQYLKIKYGLKPEPEIKENTMGTLLHTGVDEAFKGVDNTSVAKRRNLKVNDGFTLSGETDIEIYDDDTNTLHVIDNKMVKYSKYESMLKSNDNAYMVQLKAYEYLAKKVDGRDYNIKAKIAFFFKDSTRFSKPNIPSFLMVDFTSRLMSDEEFEVILNNRTSKLKFFLDADKDSAIDECSQLFWNRSTKPATKERCKSYCDVASYCPFYKKQKEFYKNRHSKSLGSLMDKMKATTKL